MNFEQFSFDPRILAALKPIGFTNPTPIQQQAIPHVLEGKDVLGLAQTGTGKTAAFMLPILQRLTQGPLRKVRALIVAPTRELAEQIHEATADFSANMNVRSISVYGGVGKNPQISALKKGAEIVVACPGRLLDLIGDGAIDLSNVEVLVLDEADRMCDMGFLPDVRRIIKHLPAQRQTLFFSATMPKDARLLANTILKDPVTVQIGMIAPAKTVSHALFPVHHKMKKKLLLELLERTATGRVLIFTRTKYRARNLARDLGRKGYRVAALQGNMSQNQRQLSINGFRDGKFDFLVATDIAARGIDVTEITHVINFDMPDTVDAYTHRIGRTGRAKLNGEAFTFTTADDEGMIRSIERTLGKQLERRTLETFDYGEFAVQSPPQAEAQDPRQQTEPRNNNGFQGRRRRSDGGQRQPSNRRSRYRGGRGGSKSGNRGN